MYIKACVWAAPYGKDAKHEWAKVLPVNKRKTPKTVPVIEQVHLRV